MRLPDPSEFRAVNYESFIRGQPGIRKQIEMRSCIFLQGFCVFLFSAFLTNRNKPPIFKQMHSKKEFRYPDDSLFLLLQPSMDAVLHTSYTFGAWFSACSGLNASISQLATGSEGISKCVLGVLDI